MPAPIASNVVLPLDTGNTGKKVRTQTRDVGGTVVHEHYFVPISERNYLGKYSCAMAQTVVPAAVHNGTTTGFIWLYNPVGSVIKMSVKKLSDNEDDETILLAGEGIVMWHSVAVTTANRRLNLTAYWGEFE